MASKTSANEKAAADDWRLFKPEIGDDGSA
jgi:hypothetical protein